MRRLHGVLHGTGPATPAATAGTTTGLRRAALAAVCGLVLAPAALVPAALAKDIGPADARCDGFAKASAEWRHCAAAAQPAASDAERFYAGYWLAKTGSYRAALDQLQAIPQPDVRTLTYIGFAYRKLGEMDAALAHYGRALGADPNFTVARAYLGEAYLSLGQRNRAGAELSEIETRCGKACAEYADLAGHISVYDRDRAAARGRG